MCRRGMVIVWLAVFVPSVSAQSDNAEATRQYSTAVRLHNLGSYDIAADAWRKFLADFPRDPRAGRALHYLGVCYFELGDLEKALATFQKMVASYPQSPLLDAAYLYLGATQYKLGQAGKPGYYARGAETLNTLLSKFPKSKYRADALFFRGECLYRQKKYAEAAAMYQRLLDEFPNHQLQPDAVFALGVVQQESGDNRAALATFQRFLARYPKHELTADVQVHLGEVLFRLRRYEEAAQRFSEAASVEGFPLADFATLRHADTQLQLKRYDEAARLYASVVQRFADSSYKDEAVLGAGKAHYMAGRFAEAVRYLRPLCDPRRRVPPEAAHWLAKSLLKQNQPAETLAVVERALRQADSGPWAARLRMDQADACYAIPERRAESLGLYAEVARQYSQDPLAADALYMAAFVALELKDYEAASRYAGQFLRTHARHELTADVIEVLAESQLLSGRYSQAEQRYAELLEKYAARPEAARWRVRYALALHLQGNYQAAIDQLSGRLPQLKDPQLAAEAQYLIGASQLALGQYAEGVASLEASISSAPRSSRAAEALLALAEAYRHTERLTDARRSVEKLIRDFPDSAVLPEAYYRLGQYAYLAGDFSAAAEAYRKVVEDWPNSDQVPPALHEWGCSELSRNAPAEAERVLSQLIDNFPDHKLMPRARYARGLARYRLKRFAEAMEDLQAVLEAGPADTEKADAQYLLGLCQIAAKQYQAAAATFRSLLEENPQYAGADNAQYQLAWALKLQGQEDQAVQVFRKLATDHPQSVWTAEALYHLGEAAYREKNYVEAAKAYYRSMSAAKDVALKEKATHKLGWAYYHQKLYDAAWKTFAYQRKTYPQGQLVADAAFMEAECLFQLGKYDEALAAYKALPELASEEHRTLALLHAGQAAGQLGQWKESLDLLTRCAKEFPDSPHADQVHYERGWALEKLGRSDEAIQAFQEAIAKGGAAGTEAAARAQYMIGEIQFERKDYAEAVKSFFKVIYGYGHPQWQAEATYEAARCFELLRRPSQAADLYRELVQKYPQSDKAALARQRLDDLSAAATPKAP